MLEDMHIIFCQFNCKKAGSLSECDTNITRGIQRFVEFYTIL